MRDKERWMELAEMASKEQDRDKLLALVRKSTVCWMTKRSGSMR